jgi:preprotein translocase subunit SecG
MKSIKGKFVVLAAFSFVALVILLIGALMLYASRDAGLFIEPNSAITMENANLIQKSFPSLQGVIQSFVEESLAQRARLQAIRQLWTDLGEFLLLLFIIQAGCIAGFLLLSRSDAGGE